MTTAATLSSRQTIWYKIILPIFWIAVFGVGTIATWMSVRQPIGVKWSFVAAWCLGSVVMCWMCAPLKRLRTDGRNLYVSNYLKEIVVPASLIDRVTENRWINIHPVTIYLRGDTEFGREIVFMPEPCFAFHWRSHPVVSEIRRLAQIAATGSMP
jgi:hypothetical protein